MTSTSVGSPVSNSKCLVGEPSPKSSICQVGASCVWGKLCLITSSPPCQMGVRRCHAAGSVELLLEIKVAVNVLYKSSPISIKAQKNSKSPGSKLNDFRFSRTIDHWLWTFDSGLYNLKCGWRDSNSQGKATRTSSVRVYQFRHIRAVCLKDNYSTKKSIKLVNSLFS